MLVISGLKSFHGRRNGLEERVIGLLLMKTQLCILRTKKWRTVTVLVICYYLSNKYLELQGTMSRSHGGRNNFAVDSEIMALGFNLHF